MCLLVHSTWNLQSIEQSQSPSKATNMFACNTWSIMKQISKCRPRKQICKRRDSGNDSQRRKHWRRRTGWSFQLSFNCNNCDQINFHLSAESAILSNFAYILGGFRCKVDGNLYPADTPWFAWYTQVPRKLLNGELKLPNWRVQR